MVFDDSEQDDPHNRADGNDNCEEDSTDSDSASRFSESTHDVHPLPGIAEME
jgi:hypothetical protein